jgi:hypothetical protein
MKFYRIDWYDSEPSAQQTDWATTQREANRIGVEAGTSSRVTMVHVPTNKAGLLAFLKEHIWCDAGRSIENASDR